MVNNNNNQPPLDIELTDDIAEGKFSNLALINHSPTEFVFDFIQVMPGVQKAKVRSRIILTPEHAKRFLTALQDNIKKFEQQFGELSSIEQNLPYNFGTPQGEA